MIIVSLLVGLPPKKRRGPPRGLAAGRLAGRASEGAADRGLLLEADLWD